MAAPILTSWRWPDGTVDETEITELVLELPAGCTMVKGEGYWIPQDPAENGGRLIFMRPENVSMSEVTV